MTAPTCGTLFLLILTVAIIQGCVADQKHEAPVNAFLGEPKFDARQVFRGERFPNIVVATDGTVIATWGGIGHDNSGLLRARRSEDGGKTWSDIITISKPGFHGGGVTVDENTGHIFAFSEDGHPPASVSVFRSTDHGKTWQRYDAMIYPDRHGNSPSMHMNERGITLRRGPHAGRLIRPARWYAGANDRSAWPEHYTNAIYSDDHGKTWHASDPFPANGTGEAAIEELSDGRLYYNSRRHWAPEGVNPRMRWVAWSNDGGKTWSDLSISDVLPDGDQNRDYGLMGGLVRLPVSGYDILLYSNIDSPDGRRNGVVWASFDGGKTWPLKRIITTGAFAYSSMAAGRPGTPSEGWIFLMHEAHGHPNATGHVTRFNLAWLLAGEETGDGDVPGVLRQTELDATGSANES